MSSRAFVEGQKVVGEGGMRDSSPWGESKLGVILSYLELLMVMTRVS